MALSDDLSRLAAQDVVYLSRYFMVNLPGATEVFRGRLRQALDGNWVFNASTGQNGVVGFNLGQPGTNWSSSESPGAGIQVSITINQMVPGQPLVERILLTNVIPAVFTE
jgi:hypothetical protein